MADANRPVDRCHGCGAIVLAPLRAWKYVFCLACGNHTVSEIAELGRERREAARSRLEVSKAGRDRRGARSLAYDPGCSDDVMLVLDGFADAEDPNEDPAMDPIPQKTTTRIKRKR